ncbi:DUF3857 domain-containing protein [Sphingomonas sp.]|uniref:DUF3857 domain-containing protein n=1 Tax=Sphingomonas sp. TaxID=28214 RepID=UPI00286B7712|nr:DUF3857 domain-containing protein [Sphingomonas sp.]
MSGGAVAALAAPVAVPLVRASRPLVAPPEAWVLPAAIPPAPTASEGAATVTLLSDSQTRFAADSDTNYFAAIYRIASSKGLDDASLQVSWDPALNTLTLHHYRILRDGKTINLLCDGSAITVVRREKNLESAALDGRLTALMQPEDVRVGDVIDMAYSLTSHDPAMGGRSEQLSGPGDGAAFGRYRMRILWPTTKAMKWRAFPGVLQPKLIKTAAGNELVADLNDVVTDGDIAAIKDAKARAAAYLKRGVYRFDRHDQAGARADAEAAVKLDPTLSGAHGLLSLILANAQDPAAAAVADKALALDAKQLLAWRAKSIDAFRRKQYAEAEKDADALVALAPKDGAALMLRGGARLAAGRRVEAMSDIDTAIAIEPSANFRRARAAVLAEAGQAAEALAEADRAVGADPVDVPARLLRANLRQDAKQLPGAIADYDRVIAVEPSPLHYLQRASAWQALDKTKSQSDIASALKVDPRSVLALAARASTAMEDGRYASTEADIASIDKIEPGNRSAASLRVRLLDRQGRHAEALRQADANVTKLHDAGAYNERCWLRATRNMGLESALTDCEAALKLSPTSAAALASRAFTKLRMGSLDGAIADYDAALKAFPRLPASLFGRAVAYARKGDRAKALGDLATAQTVAARSSSALPIMA